ncbi:MAG TPA: tRNA (adenosine(37)-N6)-threonylcarbamoyltransferase complex dimerization subunit type 1 TsaB [Chthoniobacteraceae bacterium]|jgi:tRNA threonylcarbamoyl adenosine modification protein YeaZ
MTILAIDTSTLHGSVAVVANGAVVFSEDFAADRSHSATLFTILARAKAAAPKFERIAIGLGPGSYAGIRISIAAAIGLELATGAKLVGAPSVAAWETGVLRYVATGDARRDTYYWTRVEEGVCVDGPRLLEREEWLRRLQTEELPIFASEVLAGTERIRIAHPSAVRLAELVGAGHGVQEGALEPIYLREAQITRPKDQRSC